MELPTNLNAFAKLHEIDRIQLWRFLNGQRHRVSVDVALAVEEATGGVVPMKLWASETLRLVSPWDEGAAPR